MLIWIVIGSAAICMRCRKYSQQSSVSSCQVVHISDVIKDKAAYLKGHYSGCADLMKSLRGLWPLAQREDNQRAVNTTNRGVHKVSQAPSRIITSSAKTYLLVKQRSHCQIYQHFYREWFNKSRLQTSVNLCHGSRRMSGYGLVRASFHVSQFEHKTKKVKSLSTNSWIQIHVQAQPFHPNQSHTHPTDTKYLVLSSLHAVLEPGGCFKHCQHGPPY